MTCSYEFSVGDRVLLSVLGEKGTSATIYSCTDDGYLIRWEGTRKLCVRYVPGHELRSWNGPVRFPSWWYAEEDE